MRAAMSLAKLGDLSVHSESALNGVHCINAHSKQKLVRAPPLPSVPGVTLHGSPADALWEGTTGSPQFLVQIDANYDGTVMCGVTRDHQLHIFHGGKWSAMEGAPNTPEYTFASCAVDPDPTKSRGLALTLTTDGYNNVVHFGFKAPDDAMGKFAFNWEKATSERWAAGGDSADEGVFNKDYFMMYHDYDDMVGNSFAQLTSGPDSQSGDNKYIPRSDEDSSYYCLTDQDHTFGGSLQRYNKGGDFDRGDGDGNVKTGYAMLPSDVKPRDDGVVYFRESALTSETSASETKWESTDLKAISVTVADGWSSTNRGHSYALTKDGKTWQWKNEKWEEMAIFKNKCAGETF